MENVLESNAKLSEYVVDGATLECTLGTVKSTLKMPLSHGIFLKDKAQCNVGDRIPIKNILPFGNCNITSPPPPCIPATLLPWINKKDTTLSLNEQKALIQNAICFCSIGGIITIEDSGQE
ncbi:MAG: DUF4280 domain-containing protein [Defluviitaleaceae bacterium]|nr:DUF4280 domain-containing protein [Defluviitaleaceae bacterium]